MTTHVISDYVASTIRHETTLSRGLGAIPYQPVSTTAHVFSFSTVKARTFTMAFVFTPIDIIYLKDGAVVDSHPGFTPFTTHTGSPHDTAIELPVQTIQKHGIRIGDTVKL